MAGFFSCSTCAFVYFAARVAYCRPVQFEARTYKRLAHAQARKRRTICHSSRLWLSVWFKAHVFGKASCALISHQALHDVVGRFCWTSNKVRFWELHDRVTSRRTSRFVIWWSQALPLIPSTSLPVLKLRYATSRPVMMMLFCCCRCCRSHRQLDEQY